MDSVSRQYPQRNLHGRIVHTLGRRILRGEINPGDALEAGSVMAASRTALREAIRVLAAKGLVEARPKIGTRVTPRESWNLLDPDVMAWQHGAAPSQAFLRKITEVRAVIEPQAAAFAAERADDAALATLRSTFDEMSAALAVADDRGIDAFVDADFRFHLTILRACGNDLLEQMSRVVYSALVVSFRTTSQLPGSARRAMPQHRAILRAIVARNPTRAYAAMRALVAQADREIRELVRTETCAAANVVATPLHRSGPGRPRVVRAAARRTSKRKAVRARPPRVP
jgi:DNA-binding FadR family transcriptional regulator